MHRGPTFTVDRRGRVPFAIIGVLLLVSAATIAAVPYDNGTVDRGPAVTVDRTVAATETVLRDATKTAGAYAAAHPVVEPSGFGQVLEQERPFRSYVELLVYLNTREQLQGVTQQVRGQQGQASLPAVTGPETARMAYDRTHVQTAGNGSVSVCIENITITVTEGGHPVTQRQQTLNVTVATPVLTMHDRVATFETRMNRSPVAGPGLGRGITGRLYAMGWVRGAAQASGAPIEDVIDHRHIELAAAGSAIDQQRVAFGTSDPDAERGLARATLQAGTQDMLPSDWQGLAAAGLPDPNSGATGIEGPTKATTTDTVEVGRAADRAFERLLTDDRSIETIVSQAHDVEAKLAVTTTRQSVKLREHEPRPQAGWSRTDVEEEVSVQAVKPFEQRGPSAHGQWEQLDTMGRMVIAERIVTETWSDGNNETERIKRYDEEYTVGIATHARPAPIPDVADGPIADIAAAGNPPAGITAPTAATRVEDVLIHSRGGGDQIASQAVRDELETEITRVNIEPPTAVSEWVYEDVATLREEVRRISVTADRRQAVTEATPAADLQAAIRERQEAMIDPPPQYQNRPHRALIATRAAYIDQVCTELGTNVEDTNEIQDAVLGKLDTAVAGSQEAIDEVLMAGAEYMRPEAQPISGDPPVSNLTLAVETEPSYPTRKGVTEVGPRGEIAGTQYPVSTRMVTVASLPVEEVTDTVLDRLFVGDAVSLPTAAEALQAANRVPEELMTPSLRQERATLRMEVKQSLAPIEAAAVAELARTTDLGPAERKQAVATGLRQWHSPATRVMAIQDGTAADAIAAAVTDQTTQQDRIATGLRVALGDAMTAEETTVPEGPVSNVIELSQEITKDVTAEAVTAGVENVTERLDDRLNGSLSMTFAGVPMLPKPGFWWATVNGWAIQVRGEYPTVALRSPRGAPETGGQVTYVRDGDLVRYDVTGDGHPETLGTAERVSFETWTVIIVGVPAPSGVGNTDSDAVTCSDGWTGDCLPMPG